MSDATNGTKEIERLSELIKLIGTVEKGIGVITTTQKLQHDAHDFRIEAIEDAVFRSGTHNISLSERIADLKSSIDHFNTLKEDHKNEIAALKQYRESVEAWAREKNLEVQNLNKTHDKSDARWWDMKFAGIVGIGLIVIGITFLVVMAILDKVGII